MKNFCLTCISITSKPVHVENALPIFQKCSYSCISCFGLFNESFLESIFNQIKAQLVHKQYSKSSVYFSLPNIYNTNIH